MQNHSSTTKSEKLRNSNSFLDEPKLKIFSEISPPLTCKFYEISWKHKCMKIIVPYKKFYNCNYLLVPAPPPFGRLWWGCPRSSIQRPLWLVFVLFFDALSGWHPRWGTRRATSVAFMLRHTTTTDLQKKGYISLQNYNRDKDFISRCLKIKYLLF